MVLCGGERAAKGVALRPPECDDGECGQHGEDAKPHEEVACRRTDGQGKYTFGEQCEAECERRNFGRQSLKK